MVSAVGKIAEQDRLLPAINNPWRYGGSASVGLYREGLGQEGE